MALPRALRETPSNQYGSIPAPLNDLDSLRQTCEALKQAVEVLTRQRKPVGAAAITWDNLVELDLITSDQLPER